MLSATSNHIAQTTFAPKEFLMAVHELRIRNATSYHHTISVRSADYAQAIQPRQSVTGAEFRQALSRLAAGTSIVTTYDQDAQKLGLTATAVTALSLDPPLVLVCVDMRAHRRGLERPGHVCRSLPGG